MSKNDSSESRRADARRSAGWSNSVARVLGQMAGVAGRQVDFLTGSSRRVSRKQGGKRKMRRPPASSANPVAALVPQLVRVLRRHAAEGYRSLGTDPEFWTLLEQFRLFRPLQAETTAANAARKPDTPLDGARDPARKVDDIASAAAAEDEVELPIGEQAPSGSEQAAEDEVELPIGDQAPSAGAQTAEDEVELPIGDQTAKPAGGAVDRGTAPETSGPTPPRAGAE